ncbi:MAG: Stf0 sulfotransferase family protein [Acidiferrobacterales bacterium]|nr:Stf0 sulfotransferase family protein [Acidiferrobacterales bacterium]
MRFRFPHLMLRNGSCQWHHPKHMTLHNNISYIICSTPRSGSTLLCDLLKSTQIAGRPDSFFMDTFYTDWGAYFNIDVDCWRSSNQFNLPYLEAVLEEGVGDTGVFGMRLQWESLNALASRLRSLFSSNANDREVFYSVFEATHYIHLSRDDKIAQAVSLCKAEQTGLWHRNPDGSERERLKKGDAPVYGFKALSRYFKLLEQQDSMWIDWFAQQGIHPVTVTYEELSENPQPTLEKILYALNLDPSAAEIAKPMTAKMSDSESVKWKMQFLSDSNTVR